MDGKQPQGITWVDAAILGAALFGILLAVSLLSVQAAAGVGIAVLVYVIFKLLVT